MLQSQLPFGLCLSEGLGNFEHGSNTGGIVVRPEMYLSFLFFSR